MEHRLYERIPALATVDIYRNGEYLGNFYLKNVSTGGAAIYDKLHHLNAYDFIELISRASGSNNLIPSRTHALVVQKQEQVAGAMFAPASHPRHSHWDQDISSV